MAIGYACKTLGVAKTDMRTCLLKDATQDRLMEIILHNITCLDRMIDYNIENSIRLFRISSDLIPFGSSPVNKIMWWEDFSEALKSIGQKIKNSKMRVSLHPGQYTVLNAENKDVVGRAVNDLKYHTRILDCLGLDSTHKIVLHIGGAYKDKQTSVERFMKNYSLLDESIKRRLVIENDDRIYNIQDVLEIGLKLNIPVIFDNLHHKINSSDEKRDEIAWIELCGNTWQGHDGIQKIHYSQQAKQKRKGFHSDSIQIDRFLDFYERLNKKDIDIMLEVKDKNLSCIKCVNCITQDLNKAILEKEWSRYEYSVLERSPSRYLEIRNRIAENGGLSPLAFYRQVEQALESEGDMASHIAALQQVWKHINQAATEKEWVMYHKKLEGYRQQQTGIKTVKNQLLRLAEKYEMDHLLHSYFFVL